MNIYKLDIEDLEKYASDFNNTMYGRRIWLFSKIPVALAIFNSLFYIILTIIGDFNPEMKDILSEFIIADLICICLSLIGSAFAYILYSKCLKEYIEKVSLVDGAKLKISRTVSSVKKEAQDIANKVKDTVTKGKK